MVIVENQTLEIKWSNSTKTYFVNKGYEFTKNGYLFIIKVEDLPLKSNKKVKFICDYCNGENQNTEASKYAQYCNLNKNKINGKHCCNSRECKSKKQSETVSIKPIPKGKSFGEKYPSLVHEWSIKNGKSPFEYYYSSDVMVWWKCKDGHEWQSIIGNRGRGNGCPYCSGRFATDENCLANTHPHLLEQWHPTLNNDLTPYNVKYGSNKIVWWIGECGHKWDCPITDRTINNSGCPYCRGLRVCDDNCLYSIYPDIANEWHPIKNEQITPKDVLATTHTKFWWKCSVCNHEWKTSVENRTRNTTGCPQCNESKGEKEIRKWLNENNFNYIPQKEFNGLIGLGGGNLSYDFYLPNLNTLIEYQGEFHDGSGKGFTKTNLSKQQEHDKRKRDYAIKNNIKLLEIWYWDFDKIEELLKNILINLVI